MLFSVKKLDDVVKFPTGRFNNADYVEVIMRRYLEWESIYY
jgi:hypothetical protein